jgi:hypothetical protein
MEEAPGVVSVVMRDAVGGGAHRGLRKAGVEGQWELARVERRLEAIGMPREASSEWRGLALEL